MRQPHFYSNMPPQPPYNNFPNQMPNFGYQAPPPYPRMMPPQGFPGPNPTPRFDSFMEAASKFISAYQSFQPLIAQATPMIRNLPALWKLYKGFQSVPSAQRRDEKKEQFNFQRREENSFPRENIERSYTKRESNPRNENKNGVSLPRIYQPPFHY